MTQIPTWSGGNNAPTSGRAAPGTLIGGRYTLRAAVGHGGMGTVWRAADTLLRRDVAIKEVILPPGLAPSDRDAMYERTMREARAAAALQHPAVVQVYDVVHENGRPWIVMELLDARSLADMVIEDGPVSARVVAKIGIALLGALEVAHAHGVLHRDVKPANVLICNDGRCVLTDFGVARMPTDVQLTTPGMVLGSPHFISPERAMGSSFGPPSDLFSLGVTLYTAVEGRPPFDKGDPIETMHAVVEDPPAPAVRAGSLTPVLMGLLEKDPDRRMDVGTARTILRQQLAGPLASTKPPHMMTDPYSVVPAQRPPAAPAETQPIPPSTNGQIGGRAMLAPGDSLTDHFNRVQQGNTHTPGTARRRAAQSTPTGMMPATGVPSSGDTTSMLPPREAWNGAQAAGTVSGSSAAKHKAMLAKAVATTKDTTGRAVETVQGWPRNKQLIAGGGALAVVVLLIVVFSLVGSGKDDTGAPVAGPPGSAAAQPAALPTQQYNDRGITVLVPKAWARKAGGNWVDYVDPADAKRKVRILVEPASSKATPQSFLGVAENTLKTRSASCVDPYARVGVTDAKISGRDGAVLEYTCGTGDTARHGLWGAIISGGKAYSFYLTTSEAQFGTSKPIFDQMIKSYALAS
ncbi:protein kinase [Actinoplanes bogorensis]|uniref:non-specific serine/threonine protein kinase n=1 Tax=Paractinoplanes bogorensis TaxID=1610840 RepID=A0ABS5YHU5_9ACTN|nr:serine/threonine-protein kinase [Actinoplanes bogorensis]MBU2662926.1 protein kinase [Actinoplanes bogorensis]